MIVVEKRAQIIALVMVLTFYLKKISYKYKKLNSKNKKIKIKIGTCDYTTGICICSRFNIYMLNNLLWFFS